MGELASSRELFPSHFELIWPQCPVCIVLTYPLGYEF